MKWEGGWVGKEETRKSGYNLLSVLRMRKHSQQSPIALHSMMCTEHSSPKAILTSVSQLGQKLGFPFRSLQFGNVQDGNSLEQLCQLLACSCVVSHLDVSNDL